MNLDKLTLAKFLEPWRNGPERNYGDVIGPFTLPIFRNPIGEAIGGLNDKAGMNYPCIGGEFACMPGPGKAGDPVQLYDFHLMGKLLSSEGFEHWSDHHQNCNGKVPSKRGFAYLTLYQCQTTSIIHTSLEFHRVGPDRRRN